MQCFLCLGITPHEWNPVGILSLSVSGSPKIVEPLKTTFWKTPSAAMNMY